jgi:hypothetical protein
MHGPLDEPAVKIRGLRRADMSRVKHDLSTTLSVKVEVTLAPPFRRSYTHPYSSPKFAGFALQCGPAFSLPGTG